MTGIVHSIQKFFPITPDYMTWEDFNGNLAIYYGREPIMFAPEENWKAGAENIAAMSTFSAFPVPNPDKYETWQEWAKDFTEIINGPSR